MKKFGFIFFIAVLAIFVGGCEDVVQIKLDEGSKLYVIDAFVNDLPGKQVIRVTTNDTYFSNREAPGVSDAVVVLKDLTIGKDYSFTHSANGNYNFSVTAGSPIALVDHQYELNVTVGGATYKALMTQKRTASIDSISGELFTGNGGFGPVVDTPFYLCNLYAKDKTDSQTDYYWVKTFRNDSLLFSSQDINISIDGTNGPVNIEGIDSTAFTPPITFLGFKQFRSGTSCAVEIHSISKECYYFFVQASAQINNGGLFATTPENVKTNIQTPVDAKVKAVGWFNISTVASKSIVLP
jgi:hypothetical protein